MAQTAKQFIEMVNQNKKAAVGNKESVQIVPKQSIFKRIYSRFRSLRVCNLFRNLKEFIRDSPNKLFWCSAFMVVCIAIIVSNITYSQPWACPEKDALDITINTKEGPQKLATGTQPVFFVFFFGFILFCGYFICCMKEACYKEPKKDKSKLKSTNLTPKWSKQSTMYVIKKRIESVVVDAFETECDRKNVESMYIMFVCKSFLKSDHIKTTLDGKSRNEIAMKRAANHVKDGYKGVDIISQCQLESVDRRSSLLSILFNIHNHYSWTIFIHLVVITHVTLSFYESKNKRNVADTWTIFGRQLFVGITITPKQAIPEFCLLVIELFDVIVRILWIHLCPTHILRAKSEKVYAYLNLFVLLYIFADLIVNLQVNKSLEYLIPVRPLLLILMNNNLRREVATLIGSIYEILPILRVYALVVIFCGVMAFVIFGDRQYSTQALQREYDRDPMLYGVLEENIDSFWFSVRSILTMFVFVSSGENYVTVVYPGMQIHSTHGGLVLLFFIPVIFCGMFTMMALITGIFEDVFVKKEAINRMRDLWWKRTGIISAFLLLDNNNNDGLLTLDEFIEFVLFLRRNKKDHVNRLQIFKLFKLLDTDNSGAIELSEFVTGIEKLCDEYNGFDRYVIDRIISSEKRKQNHSNLYNILAIIEMIWLSWCMNKLRGFLFLFNFWTFCWMNILPDDIVSFATKTFLFIHIFDVFIKFIVMKPYRYLYYSKYNKNEIISEFANRADLIIASICFVGYIVGLCVGYQSNHIYFNILAALILLRVFVFWNVSLRFLFMMKSAFASLSALFIIMFCVFFAYGTIGVSLFKGNTQRFAAEQTYMKNSYGNANFDCLENAMITLVQSFVGEAFHEIMLATKNADVAPGAPAEQKGDNWIICFYIVSYFLIMTLLFGNLFFGLLLSIFGSLYDFHKSGQKLTHHTIKKASQLRLMNDDQSDEDNDGDDGDEGLDVTKQECALKSRARKESVTLDIVEPIPEEMAHNLSIDKDQQQIQHTITDFDANNTRGPLTPTQTEFDIHEITKIR